MIPSNSLLQLVPRCPSIVNRTAYSIFPSFEKPKATVGFPIDYMTENKKLLSNTKFARLLKNISNYNQNLKAYGEDSIIKYKLYEFLHSSLCVCHTKTNSEIDHYLDTIDNWFSKYRTKRGLQTIQKKVKTPGKQEQIIRKTFKSNLPLQINQYKRKILYSQLIKDDSDLSSEISFGKNDQMILPAFRSSQTEILQMRKKREEKEESLLIKYLKKNCSRFESFTTKNFYRSAKNRNDFIRQNQATMSSKQESIRASTIDKFFGTSQSFSKIKDSKLKRLFGRKNMMKENIRQQQKDSIRNIDGLGLIKNPYDVPKKKGKKAK